MNHPHRLLLLLVSLVCLTGEAAPRAAAATVSVGAGASVSFDSFPQISGDEKVRVGFFKDYVEAEPGALIGALSRGTPAAQQYLAANFIPLGEPAASVFSNYGISSAFLGSTSTVALRQIPAGSGHLSISGSISGITFTTSAPANTLTSDGLPRSSRLFLLVYDTMNPDEVCWLGVYSASNWLVPSGTSTTIGLPLNAVDTGAEAFFGNAVSFGGNVTLQLGSLVCMPEPGTGALLLLSWGILSMRSRKSCA